MLQIIDICEQGITHIVKLFPPNGFLIKDIYSLEQQAFHFHSSFFNSDAYVFP